MTKHLHTYTHIHTHTHTDTHTHTECVKKKEKEKEKKLIYFKTTVNSTMPAKYSFVSIYTPGVGDGQGGLACCNSWGRKKSDTTERLNWTDHLFI